MDYNKIGNFIMTERKLKKLTQAKLAEKIFVSEKTVSKWENGKGIPDTHLLPKLCEIFDVSLNELLQGERFDVESQQHNDKLLLNMTEELGQKNKTIIISMYVIIFVSIISIIMGALLVKFLMSEGIWKIITILGICIFFLIPCFYALKLEVSVGTYKCKKCGCEITPTYGKALNAIHIGMTRYLKCPKCNKHTWCKKVIK